VLVVHARRVRAALLGINIGAELPVHELLERGRVIAIDIPNGSRETHRRIILTETYGRYAAAFGDDAVASVGAGVDLESRPAADVIPDALRRSALTTLAVGRWGPAHRLLGGNKAESLLERSGWRTSPDAFAGIRAVIGATGLFFVIITPWPGPLLSIFWCTAGVLAPLILAGRAAKRRLGDIDAEIPQLLDLLAAASSAGLSAPLALRRAVDALTGPIVGELHRVLRAVDLGGRWRDELRAASDRLDLADFRRAVAVITRTETLGASLSRATSELAASVRQARRARADRREGWTDADRDHESAGAHECLRDDWSC
jgi:hypothetical protein